MDIPQKAVYQVDKAVNKVVGLILVIILLYGGYALWDTYAVLNGAGVSGELMGYKPTRENPSLADLQAINPDVKAWLTVDDTHIDYPVLQGKDNMEYLNKDLYGEFNVGGSIFLDYQNDPFFRDFYSILYGHHMAAGAMFGDVKEFEQKSYFDSHKTGLLITTDSIYDLEIFACMAVTAYDSFIFVPGVNNLDAQIALLDYIENNALHYRDIGVSTDDRIISLSTCSSASTNGRTIVLARLLEYDEPGGEDNGEE